MRRPYVSAAEHVARTLVTILTAGSARARYEHDRLFEQSTVYLTLQGRKFVITVKEEKS